MGKKRSERFMRIARRVERRLLRGVPEHGLFRDEAGRARALAELDEELHDGRGIGRIETALMLVCFVGLGAIVSACTLLVPPPRHPLVWLAGPSLAIAAVTLTLWSWRRGVARRLRDKLIESGVPVCRGCGYPLDGLSRSVCPECGREAEADVAALMGLDR